MSDMAKTDVGNKQPLHYEVINNSEKKRFEIHIDDKIALEDLEFFTTSAGEKGIEYKHTEVPEDRSYAARGRYVNDKSVQEVKP